MLQEKKKEIESAKNNIQTNLKFKKNVQTQGGPVNGFVEKELERELERHEAVAIDLIDLEKGFQQEKELRKVMREMTKF